MGRRLGCGWKTTAEVWDWETRSYMGGGCSGGHLEGGRMLAWTGAQEEGCAELRRLGAQCLDGRVIERTDGQTDGRRKGRCFGEWELGMVIWVMGGGLNGPTDGQTGGQADDGQMNAQMERG